MDAEDDISLTPEELAELLADLPDILTSLQTERRNFGNRQAIEPIKKSKKHLNPESPP
ncbi:MAG: hypothetical protein ABFC57_17070 [Veillonellales bacterium]